MCIRRLKYKVHFSNLCMNSYITSLPIDLVLYILETRIITRIETSLNTDIDSINETKILDILDIINLRTSCKYFYNIVKLDCYCKKYITFTTKNNTKYNFTSLNGYVDMITMWLNLHKYQKDVIYMPKKFFHSKMYQNIELRFTKNNIGRCTFLITDISHITPLYSNIQVVYEPQYKRYRLSGLHNAKYKLIIPYLLLFLGFKVLFKVHGYEYVKCFEDINISYFDQKDIDKIPSWFKKILYCPNFNGMILKDLIDGYVEVF